MNILYIDCWDFNEDYSANPHRYGSAPCFARYAKELLNNDEDQFFLLCHAYCFSHLRADEHSKNCLKLTTDQCLRLQAGEPLAAVCFGLDAFDIIVHHNPRGCVNLEGLDIPCAHWSPMSRDEGIHSHSLFYNDTTAKYGYSYRVKIGTFVGETFTDFSKHPYIFQCSRLCEVMNQIHVARFCLDNGIQGVFAGRPNPDYPLKDYIDGKTTHFLGEIPYGNKMRLYSNATLSTLCQTEAMPFSLSAVESLSAGTPICGPQAGGFLQLIQPGVNGFFWNGSNLKAIWEGAQRLSPRHCYTSAKTWSHKEMVASFRAAFKEVIKNHLFDQKMRGSAKLRIARRLPVSV